MVAGKLPQGSRERRNLDMVMAGAERSRDLVKQILSFARKEERRGESFDLAAVAREALRMMRASLPATIRLDEAIVPVPSMAGDPNQLHQVIINLVTNAAQAIGEAMGTIDVTVKPDLDGTHLRLAVADTGCGMDEATQARIFEPFFTTKGVGQGTGLGLDTVQRIVKKHRGTIQVTSKPGDTLFQVWLPLADTPA
jgi:signal transduction histidine kinase